MTQRTLAPTFVNSQPAILIVLLMVDSLHFVFARLLLPHLPPVTSAMYVLMVATLELLVFQALRRSIRFEVLRANLAFFVTIGILVAGATAASFTAVAYIDPGTASLLAQTATIFALLFSVLWLREQLSLAELAGALVALAGVFAISFQPGDYLRLGSMLVLAVAFMYALHTAVVKRYGSDIEFGNFFLFRVGSIALFLLLFAAGRGQLELPSSKAWRLIILAATVDVVISRALYYLALRRLRLSLHAIILTLSPVITILWSLALFGTQPTLQGLLGGAAVISGVAIVTVRRRETAPAGPGGLKDEG
jgi:drug/metabolite transporter (DMT)-like permease